MEKRKQRFRILMRTFVWVGLVAIIPVWLVSNVRSSYLDEQRLVADLRAE